MTRLTQKNYAQLGKKVCEVYMNKGFDVNSRAEIDCEIYDMFCQLGLINDFETQISISKKLSTSSKKIALFKEYRRQHNRIDEYEIKNNIKMILKNNCKRLHNGKFIITVKDAYAKAYIKGLLSSANETYEYTQSARNLSINASAFIFLIKSLGCKLEPALRFLERDKSIKREINKTNITIPTIYNNNTSTADKLIALIQALSPLLAPFLVKFLTKF